MCILLLYYYYYERWNFTWVSENSASVNCVQLICCAYSMCAF